MSQKPKSKSSDQELITPALTNGQNEQVVELDISEFIPSAPDGGWGWVVVLASFLNHFIIDGICYAFGSFMLDYSTYFQSSAAATSALMSTLIGCYLLSAPIASALLNKFGCRPVGIAGSLLAAGAFVASTFATSINVMIFVFGVLGGFGFGLLYMPAIISVSMYFEKRRAIAIGIAMCGTGVGTFTFGPLSKFLLEKMDWKGAHFILAGVILHGAVFSALIRPLRSKHDKQLARESKSIQQTSNEKPVRKDTPTPTRYVISSQPNLHTIRDNALTPGSTAMHRSTSRLGSTTKVTTHLTLGEAEDLKRPMYKKDIFYSGSIYNLKEYKETGSVKDFITSVTNIPTVNESDGKSPSLRCKCLPRQVTDVLSEMIDLSLFKSAAFNVISFVCLLIMLAYFIPFAYTSVRAVDLGIDTNDASFLISFIGVSTMIGRLGACAIAQMPNLRSLIVHNIFLLLAGLSCIAVPWCHTYATMAAAASCYGVFIGGHVSLSPIVLVEILGLNKLTTAFGLLTLVRGISALAGPPLAGQLFDMFKTYDISFYMAGGLILTSTAGFCLLELKWFKEKETSSRNGHV